MVQHRKAESRRAWGDAGRPSLGHPAPSTTTCPLGLPEILMGEINGAKLQSHKPTGNQISRPQTQALPLLRETLPILPGIEQGKGSGAGVAPCQVAWVSQGITPAPRH